MFPLTEVSVDNLKKVSAADFVPWDDLKNKTVFITGATGLIGYSTVLTLLQANKEKDLNITIIALVRSLDRAKDRFESWREDTALSFVTGSVEALPEISENIDYIIHGASQTASKCFVESPVETIKTSVIGTLNLLELAREKKVNGFIYLSSMEVYGYPEKGHKVTEAEAGALSSLNVRNSYPISKLECESLCCAYAKEFGVPTRIVRLTQTFGPGVNYYDNRIFAYFGRCAVEKENIVLKTGGETERSYLCSIDAVSAILTALLRGNDGEAYNVADESTYCSIAEMAERVARKNGIKVCYELQDVTRFGYSQTLFMNLDTKKIKALGWYPLCESIDEMYDLMIQSMLLVHD